MRAFGFEVQAHSLAFSARAEWFFGIKGGVFFFLKRGGKGRKEETEDVVPVQERQESVLAVLLRGCVPA